MGLGTLVIEVVLPTYNGAAYLQEQVESIHRQTLRPQRLLVRDDGSSDGTRALLVELQQQYGSWLELLPMGRNLGCIANVNCLLEASRAPYVALADQDDIWLPEKLVENFALLQRLEHQHGVQRPLLVHSDLELMDADGRRLGSTYVKHQHLDPRRTAPEPLALTNVVTGCTAMVNRALLDRALPIPSEALMHDWWLALVASCFGAIGWLPQPTVLYRQHGGNVLGAQGLGPAYWMRRLRHLLTDPAAGGHTRAALRQAACFEQRYGQALSPLPALMHLRRRSRCQALSHHLTHGSTLNKHGPFRTVALVVLLLLLPAASE